MDRDKRGTNLWTQFVSTLSLSIPHSSLLERKRWSEVEGISVRILSRNPAWNAHRRSSVCECTRLRTGPTWILPRQL